jgi:hypothetical protein
MRKRATHIARVSFQLFFQDEQIEGGESRFVGADAVSVLDRCPFFYGHQPM